VCGHFGCGGVQAALEERSLGLSDQWLKHVRGVRDQHREHVAGLDQTLRFDRLCELNVIEQVMNVCRTNIVRDAWSHKQRLSIHGWIYAVGNGLLRDLAVSISCPDEVSLKYKTALTNLIVPSNQ